jgi:hypothetical protein
MRNAIPIALVAALALLAGCGDSGGETTAPASTNHAETSAKQVRAAFLAEPSCKRPPGASRWGCSLDPYRCQSVVTDRGWSVSCSRRGRSVAFLIRR